jgi:hypothetical protein
VVSRFSLFCFFLTKKMRKIKDLRTKQNLKKKGNRKHAARVFLARCAVEKSEIVCAWPALSKQSQS